MTSTTPIIPTVVPDSPSRPGKVAVVAGWLIGGLAALGLTATGVMDLLKPDQMVEDMAKFGYRESVLRPLGIVVIISGLLYLFPRTAVLGAILLTGYMGGAVNHHARQSDPIGMFAPAILASALLWVGLILRDGRMRQLLPLRRV